MALGDLMSSRQITVSMFPTPSFHSWNLLPYNPQVVMRKGFQGRIREPEFGDVDCVEGISAGFYDIRGCSIHTHRFIVMMSNDCHKHIVRMSAASN